MSKLRKEVLLEQEVIHKLVILADKKQWSLKKMMESILIKAVKIYQLPKKIILNITPQTHVRATQGDSIFFRIPREKLRPSGLSQINKTRKIQQVQGRSMRRS